MKKQSFSNQIKEIASFIFIMFVCTALATSCKKDSGSSSSVNTVSEDEAAEAITEVVTPESGGMVDQVDNSVAIAKTYNYPCGQSFDSSISETNAEGSRITYSFNLDWNWMLNCAKGTLDLNFNGHSIYDAPRMSSDDSSEGSVSVSDLDKSVFTVNTSYIRNGSQQSKILNKNSFTSKIIINSSNINVSTSTEEITSGTATVSISGASTGGRSFSYSGTITFNGNKTATLVLGSGNTYNINW